MEAYSQDYFIFTLDKVKWINQLIPEKPIVFGAFIIIDIIIIIIVLYWRLNLGPLY